MEKAPAFRVEHVDMTLKKNPYPAATVFVQAIYVSFGNWKRIKGVGREYLEAGAVVAVQPILGTDPDKTVTALDDIKHQTLRQTIRSGDLLIIQINLAVQLNSA